MTTNHHHPARVDVCVCVGGGGGGHSHYQWCYTGPEDSTILCFNAATLPMFYFWSFFFVYTGVVQLSSELVFHSRPVSESSGHLMCRGPSQCPIFVPDSAGTRGASLY